MRKQNGYSTLAMIGIAVGSLVAVVVFLNVIAFFGRGSGLLQNQFFAPKEAAVQREVFENTKAFQDGVKQELLSLQLEYIKAPSADKQAIATIIKHKAAQVDTANFPADLRVFLNSL